MPQTRKNHSPGLKAKVERRLTPVERLSEQTKDGQDYTDADIIRISNRVHQSRCFGRGGDRSCCISNPGALFPAQQANLDAQFNSFLQGLAVDARSKSEGVEVGERPQRRWLPPVLRTGSTPMRPTPRAVPRGVWEPTPP